jgi:hypothetical protein
MQPAMGPRGPIASAPRACFPSRGGVLTFTALILFLVLTSWSPLTAQAQTATKEYEIKSVFLYNFAQFVEWPDGSFSDPQQPMVIGILGTDPFGSFLDETVRGEKIQNHPLVVARYRKLEDVKDCQILYLSRSEAASLDPMLVSLKGRNILTVSDAEDFANHGGVIQFRTESNKIRLTINTAAARAARLTISSKLLKLAELVDRPGK